MEGLGLVSSQNTYLSELLQEKAEGDKRMKSEYGLISCDFGLFSSIVKEGMKLEVRRVSFEIL